MKNQTIMELHCVENVPNVFTGVFQTGFTWFEIFVIIKFEMTAVMPSNIS